MILNVRLYDIFRREVKVSDEAAKEIILGMEEVAEEALKRCEQKIEFLTKDIQSLATHFEKHLDLIEKHLDLKLNSMEERINANIERTKFLLAKWMLGAWITQLVAFTSLFIFLKK